VRVTVSPGSLGVLRVSLVAGRFAGPSGPWTRRADGRPVGAGRFHGALTSANGWSEGPNPADGMVGWASAKGDAYT